ncbi:hypothetical protein XHC_4017 [Xanthomonas hortorum pv. carotae str. M081]|nr:hypothetical protein XHC_4017 [Xanthomonas hortorum pv. carotae str. M081]
MPTGAARDAVNARSLQAARRTEIPTTLIAADSASY